MMFMGEVWGGQHFVKCWRNSSFSLTRQAVGFSFFFFFYSFTRYDAGGEGEIVIM